MEDGRKLQHVVTCAVSLVTVTMGIYYMWSSPMIRKLWVEESKDILDNIYWSLLMGPLGVFVGAVAGGLLNAYIGRRIPILLSGLIFATALLFVGSSLENWAVSVMQALCGFATGMMKTIIVIYISEIADKDIRGRLIVVTQFMSHFGGLIVISIRNMGTYRTLNYWLIVVPLLSIMACYPIPESPYYLLKKGKMEKARKELWRLQENVGTEDIDTQLQRIKSHVNEDTQNSMSIKFFTKKQYWKAFIIVFGLQTFYLFSGLYAITPYFFEAIQLAELVTKKLIGYLAIKFVVGILTAILVEKIGRRPLLMFSFIGCSITLAVLGTYFLFCDVIFSYDKYSRPYPNIPFSGVIIFFIISSFGLDSLIDVIKAEMFPLNVRTTAVVIVNVYGGLGFLTSKLFRKVLESGGLPGTFYLSAVVSLIGSIFTYYVLPETSGKSLKEIQELLKGDDNTEGEEMRTTNSRI